jgi:predicted transposase/invertase (TIGR01784 family)
MTEDFVKEVEDMCNVSSMYYNDGRQEGRLEGALNEKKSVIIEMFKKKFPIEVIAEITHISVAETEEIINSNK